MPNSELSPVERQDKPFIEARGKAAIIKYLTNNQGNLLGTILGFKKGWRKAKSNYWRINLIIRIYFYMVKIEINLCNI